MNTKRYCDVCQAEIVGRADDLELILRQVLTIRGALVGWPDHTTDVCRRCLLEGLCLTWGERTTGEAVAPKPAEPRDIVGSVIIPAKHYWPHDEGDAHYGPKQQYVVRDVFMHPWQGRGPVPDVDLFTVGAGLTLQALLP